MKSPLKITLIVLSVFLIIGLFLVLFLPSVIDLTAYRTKIEKFMAETLHRDVSIKEIRVSIIKGIGAELSDIRIGKEPEQIDIEKMRIKVAILPLLHKRIEMTGIALDNIRISLKRDDGKNNRITISGVRLPLSTYKGSLINMSGIKANIYRGTLIGDLRAEKTEKEFRYELNHTSEKIELEPFIKDAIGSKVTITGFLKLDGRLKGVGNNLESLEGSGLLNVGKGKIKGLEIGELLGTLGKVSFKRPVSFSDFDRITGHYSIGGGYLKTEDLEMVGKDIYFKGRGSYGLINSKLDFLINGKIIDIPIEIKVEGTSSDPKYHIKSRGAEKRVLEELGKEAIKRKTGKDVDVEGVMKGLFKKK